MATMLYANDCRTLITDGSELGLDSSLSSAYTAANIALFPLLFFFSGLYYTDILSTGVVLRVYKSFLARHNDKNSSFLQSSVALFVLGLLALAMRQTNIFWVAVFLAALEVVKMFDGVRSSTPVRLEEWTTRTVKDIIVEKFREYSAGKIHDVALRDAGIEGKLSIPWR